MKKIGFVDYYLSEWHANNYPEWIKTVSADMPDDYCVAYAFAQLDISPLDGVSTDEWADKFGAEKCDTIEELCQKSDYIIILAPSNPETHLELAEKVLPFGKPTYIDKTFAPDFETAKKIFEIAEKYKTPFFSTSALRYAEEFEDLGEIDNAIITGGGMDFEEYIIHPVEIFVSLYSEGAKKVKVESLQNQKLCRLKTESGKEAAIAFSPCFGFSVLAQKDNGECFRVDAESAFFLKLIKVILEFFKSGENPFDPQETLEVMRIREGLIKAAAKDGEWIEI